MVPDPDATGGVRAWTLLTALAGLRGHEEGNGTPRPGRYDHSRDFGGDNWLDKREKARAYADRDPAVVVVGAAKLGVRIRRRDHLPTGDRRTRTR